MTPEEIQQQARLRAMALRGEDLDLSPREADTLSGVGSALAGLGGRSVRAMSQDLTQRGDALRSLVMDNRRQVNAERHQQTTEDLQRQQIQQGKFVQGPLGVLNARTGQIVPGTERGGPSDDPTAGLTPNQLEQMWEKLGHSVSTVEGRSRLAPKYRERLDASERIKALITGPDGQLLDLTPQQLTELAAASGALITQGSPTEHTIQSMLPKGIGMKTAQFAEWLTNNPRGAGQKAFIEMMKQQAEREERLVSGQLLRAQTQPIPTYAPLRKRDKKRFEAILKQAGVDPGLVDDAGMFTGATETEAAPNPKVRAAMDWLKANPNHPDAPNVAAKLKAMGQAP